MENADLFKPENLRRWTQADPACGSTGNYIGGDFSEFYVGPCSITRDTEDAVSLSNWEAMVEELDSKIEHEDSGETSFNHWACGWYSIYLIHHTDTKALKAADDMAAALSDHPVLDEERWSEKETEQESEAWDDWAASDWRDTVEKALNEYAPEDVSPYWAYEILDNLPDADSKLAKLWHTVGENLGWMVQHFGDGPRFNFREASETLSCGGVGASAMPSSGAAQRETVGRILRSLCRSFMA